MLFGDIAKYLRYALQGYKCISIVEPFNIYASECFL